MGSLRINAWRLILAGGLAFFARGAAAQTGYSASDVAGMPGNACENLPMFNWNCPTCGGASTNVYSTLPSGMGDCDCQLESDNMSPFGVEQSMSQGFSAVLDSGAVHAGTVPGGCSSCGAGGPIPAASQMIRFQFPRIWRSTWTHDGSFGTGMYSGYDYYAAYTSAGTDSLVEIRDPNTGFIERFMPSSGTWIPTPGVGYQYDTIHRLDAGQRGQVTSGSNTIATPSSSQARTLTAAGDWSQWISSAGTDNRTHNNLHALTARSVLTPSLSYDADWNQVDDGVSYKFVYDANDQLQQVLDRGSLALVESMAYDAFGRRTQKVASPPTTTTNYFYNDQQVIEQYFNGTNAQAYYTYADGIDERIAITIEGSLFYYHANRLGSTYLLTDGTGGIVERYAYSPYGSPAVSTSAYVPFGSERRNGDAASI